MEAMSATLPDSERENKSLVQRILENRELFPAMLVIVVGVVSFGLGRLSVPPSGAVAPERLLSATGEAQSGFLQPAENKAVEPSATTLDGIQTNAAPPAGSNPTTASSGTSADTAGTHPAPSGEKKYVASKNSNKYHLPWCSGAARIAEENKIWFASKEEAAAAGYTPAANCKGI